MNLELVNLAINGRLWEYISLSQISDIQSHVSKHDIFETDQIKFNLAVEPGYKSAKIIIEGLEIVGNLLEDNEFGALFEWMPKKNKIYGYDALFLHFFGIASFGVEMAHEDGSVLMVVFEPINIYGRRITAQRAESMLTYISNHADKHVLNALSPTTYGSKLVHNGIAVADLLLRLESTLRDVEYLIKNIIKHPITSLRSKSFTINNPVSDQINDYAIGWITEYAGLGIDASCEQDGLFRYGLSWKGMAEVNTVFSRESTDIYENQLVHYYLLRLAAEARRILFSCEEQIRLRQAKPSREYGDYQSFYDIARKGMNASVLSYSLRAKNCIKKLDEIISAFDKIVPTTKRKIDRITVTEKLKSNRHYMLFLKSIKEWVEVRDINWIEQNIISSVNSIPKLFEYYTILVVDQWLKSASMQPSKEGLFDGFLSGKSVRLSYEPSYARAGSEKSEHLIWAADFNVSKGRRPDIVIDINRENIHRRMLLILDAKCRAESVVINQSLPECALKYGYGIRDSAGTCPVRAVVMLYPKNEKSTDSFFSFYKSPFDLFGDSPALPVLGAQRISINNGGTEDGLSKFLEKITSILI